MEERQLTRIAALLRKAEGTDNEHEADAYLQAAQRLATLSSVDLAVARAHTSAKQRRSAPTQRTITIGEQGKRGLRTFVALFLAIGRANTLTCDIAKDSTRIYAYGFDADIDAVEALYASLVIQMVRASDEFIKSRRFAQETIGKWVRTDDSEDRRWLRSRAVHTWVERPVHATTARVNFQQAFAERVGARLKQAREEAIADYSPNLWPARPGTTPVADTEADQGGQPGSSPTGVALVLRARDLEIAEHHRTHSMARGFWRGGAATTGQSELSRRAGDKAGRSARLGGEKAIGGHAPQIGAPTQIRVNG